MTFPLMDRTRRLTEEALEEAKLDWKRLTGVLLVGGSTRMPMVRHYVSQMSGQSPRAGVNVDEVVALGAAIQAAMAVGTSADPATPRFTLAGARRISDVMSHSLGTVAVSPDGAAYVNEVVIRRNVPIPAASAKSYLHATHGGANTKLEVYLTQGESPHPLECSILGKYVFSGIRPTAAEATIGIVDRIFSRVGASDNLARGQSTFLVEMNETANILNNATARSLILLDEVGRGTSTFDGLSIAWSVAEHLHDHAPVAARTLFATHYHEMTELALLRPRVKNLTMAVREWNDTIVFLRKVLEGAADRSYGIQVARLAGLPRAVVDRALEVLANLEREELSRDGRPKLARHLGGGSTAGVTGGEASEPAGGAAPAQLGLFVPEEDPIVEMVRQAPLDGMTPLEALNFLAEMKRRLAR